MNLKGKLCTTTWDLFPGHTVIITEMGQDDKGLHNWMQTLPNTIEEFKNWLSKSKDTHESITLRSHVDETVGYFNNIDSLVQLQVAVRRLGLKIYKNGEIVSDIASWNEHLGKVLHYVDINATPVAPNVTSQAGPDQEQSLFEAEEFNPNVESQL